MKEFMLLIRNEGDSKSALSPQQQQFLTACQVYIEDLLKNGNLKSAQPLVREGKMISGTPGAFKDGPYNETKEILPLSLPRFASVCPPFTDRRRTLQSHPINAAV